MAGAVLQAAQGLEQTPLAPVYEVIRDKVQEAADSGDGETDTPAPGTRKKSSGEGRALPPAAAVPGSTTSPETLEQQRRALQKALNNPLVGKVVRTLVDHQDEILEKLDQLARAAQNGQGDAAIQQEMGKYQDQLRTIGKILDLAARWLN